jgi:hypothetical protein
MFSLYSSKHNVVLYSIPKNCMTAMIYHLKMAYVNNQDIPDNRKIICILRNPLERLVSSYLFLRECYKFAPEQISMFRKLDKNKTDIIYKSECDVGFQEYINEIYENGPYDDHNLQQSNYLYNSESAESPTPMEIKLKGNSSSFLLPVSSIKSVIMHQENRNINKIDYFIDFNHIKENIRIGNTFIPVNTCFFHQSSEIEKRELLRLAEENLQKIKFIYHEDFTLYETLIRNQLNL